MLPESLPLPATTADEGRKAAIAELNLSIDELEKKLQVGGGRLFRYPEYQWNTQY